MLSKLARSLAHSHYLVHFGGAEGRKRAPERDFASGASTILALLGARLASLVGTIRRGRSRALVVLIASSSSHDDDKGPDNICAIGLGKLLGRRAETSSSSCSSRRKLQTNGLASICHKYGLSVARKPKWFCTVQCMQQQQHWHRQDWRRQPVHGRIEGDGARSNIDRKAHKERAKRERKRAAHYKWPRPSRLSSGATSSSSSASSDDQLATN